MKKLVVLTVTILFSAIYVHAQTADPEADYIRKAYSKDKKTIVEEYMKFNVQDSAKFWPVYSNYEIARQKIAQDRINTINAYVSGYDNLSAEDVDKIVKSAFDNTISLDKLNQEYYDKMKKAVGAIPAAKYMQLEIYLQTIWKAVVQSNIPLIGAIDKTQKD